MTTVQSRPDYVVKPGADPCVRLVKIKVPKLEWGKNTWERWFLLRGDVHWDNPKCDRKLETRHLNQAVEREAGIIDVGDLFCAMQGKYDLRSDKSSLRPEHQKRDYLDALVATAAEYYEPYAHNILSLGQGNHETAIQKRHETNLTERLVASLNTKTGSSIWAAGYTGWVRFEFAWCTRRCSYTLWWDHGSGGGGPVTLDMIQMQRRSVFIENADIIVAGHTHDVHSGQIIKLRCNKHGKIERRSLWRVKVGSYKDDYGDGAGGWHIETGKPPKPVGGAYWLRFYIRDQQVQFQIIPTD
jgi:hypothetical protein